MPQAVMDGAAVIDSEQTNGHATDLPEYINARQYADLIEVEFTSFHKLWKKLQNIDAAMKPVSTTPLRWNRDAAIEWHKKNSRKAPWLEDAETGGFGALATAAIAADGVASITVKAGGSGYHLAPTVIITGDGTGADAVATVDDGSVVAITVTNSGSRYSKPPTISFDGAWVSIVNSGTRSNHRNKWIKKGYLKQSDFARIRVRIHRVDDDGVDRPMPKLVQFVRKPALDACRSREATKSHRREAQLARNDRPKTKLEERWGDEKVILILSSHARKELNATKRQWYRWRDEVCLWLDMKLNRRAASDSTATTEIDLTEATDEKSRIKVVYRDRKGNQVPKPSGAGEASSGDGAFEYCLFTDFERIKLNRGRWKFYANDAGIYTLEEAAHEISVRTGKSEKKVLDRLRHNRHTKKMGLQRVRLRSKHICNRKMKKAGEWKEAKRSWPRLLVKTGFTVESVEDYIQSISPRTVTVTTDGKTTDGPLAPSESDAIPRQPLLPLREPWLQKVEASLGIQLDLDKKTINGNGKSKGFSNCSAQWHIFLVAAKTFPNQATVKSILDGYPGDASHTARRNVTSVLNKKLAWLGIRVSNRQLISIR